MKTGPEKVAVIDVGSNSCRMVIYERSGSALLPYFNEKTLAGLGRNLSQSGRLYPTGRRKALETLRRFRATLEGLGVSDFVAVATAAVREAKDGPDFQIEAAEALGRPLRILSGADEGRLSALGVRFGLGKFSGIIADLGGSSVEFQACPSRKPEPGESFLLGPLARGEDQALPVQKRKAILLEHLAKSKFLISKPETIIAVGGAWRNVAAVHMMLTNYPLRVVNRYPLSRKALEQVIEAMARADRDDALKARIGKVAKKRYDTMLHATIVLDSILETSGLKSASISAYGLRDGVLNEDIEMPSASQTLADTIQLYFNLSEASMAFGSSLYDFIGPLLAKNHPDKKLIQAICLMGDAGARMHPDHRPDLIFQHILRAPLPWLDHRGRLMAAYSLASRYTYKFAIPEAFQSLQSSTDQRFAHILGTAMRLGGAFSGRSSSILTTAKLEKHKSELVLRIWRKNEDMVSGTVKRRLRQLAELMELEPAIELADRF